MRWSARSGAIDGSSVAFSDREAAEPLDEVLLALDAVDVGPTARVHPPAVLVVLEVPGAHVGERRRAVEVVAPRPYWNGPSPESWSRIWCGIQTGTVPTAFTMSSNDLKFTSR